MLRVMDSGFAASRRPGMTGRGYTILVDAETLDCGLVDFDTEAWTVG